MQNTDRLCMGCMNDNGGEQICPICGYDKNSPQNPQFLVTHTWLKGRYLIGKVIDNNGEGATYFGWDNESDTIVQIREYCPTGLCERSADGTLSINEGAEYTYNEGLLAFIEMAKTLSSLKDVNAVMNVYDVFEDNGTAYYVVQTVSGITLREFLLRNGGTLKWEQARPLFMPLLSSLKTLHAAGVFHRGISPDTLLVGRDGIIRITGFCIAEARTARNDMTAQLFPGFAAIEQYGFDGQQGPWTDVYGFAATLFRTLIGNPPPEATDRVTNDNMTIPGKVAQELPQYVLVALADALQILPEDRTQSIEDLKTDLTGDGEDDFYDDDEYDDFYDDRHSGTKHYGVIAAIVTVLVIVVAFGILATTVFHDTFFPPEISNPDVQAPTSSNISLMPLESTGKMFEVPNVMGATYAQVAANVDYAGVFEFVIVGAEYNDEYDVGYIIEQSPKAPETAERGQVIEVKISLGSALAEMPDLSELTADQAIIELMRLGFFYDSIEIMETYDDTATPEVVIETDPKAGEDVNVATGVKIFVNSYKAESSRAPEPIVSVVIQEPPVVSTSSTPSESDDPSDEPNDTPSGDNTDDTTTSVEE